MKKHFFALTFIIFSALISQAQNNQQKFWNLLLNNNREEASRTLKKSYKKDDIELLLANEILRVELGRLTANETFISDFLEQPDFEYYLYALWNESFIFDSYLSSGLNLKNTKNIKAVFNSNIKNSTTKDAIFYLQSVAKRYNNDWDEYFELNKQIHAITNWQYCGVFENLNKSGLDKEYPPETIAFSSEPFDANSNGKVNWYKANTEKEPYQFFTNHEEYGSGVSYAQTFITAPDERRVLLRIGNGSAFKIWLNDVLIFENSEDVTSELNGYQVKITVPKGVSRLLIKNAESNYGSYFMTSLFNENKTPVTDFVYSSDYKTYAKGTLSGVNPVKITNEFEEYFINKRKQNPDNFLYDYCLARTYLRNSKFNEAKEILLPLIEKHPKSSLIRKMLISAYDDEGDYTSINELRENIEIDDKDYYLPLLLKIMDSKELSRMSLSELETFLEKLRQSTDLDLLSLTADFYLNARKGDRAALRNNLDDLVSKADGNAKLMLRYAPLYSSVFEDDETTIKILEKINNNYFSYAASKSLHYYYDKQGKKDQAFSVITKDLDNMSNDNYYLKNIVKKLQDNQKFKESVKFIDDALKNYPYSFTMLELKGDALLQLKNKSEAIKNYEESLTYNSSYQSLRKKIKDLKNEKNLLDDLIPDNLYEFIKANKNKITKNNYGFNILLDDGNVELYSEGGGKYRFIFLYEITSDSGVERFKEYNLGLSGSYSVIKSEIVKDNGSVVPADKSGSNLVFNGLSIGDVVYIDYESSFSSVGRFYKDYTDYFQFDTFHPIVKSSLQILVPKSMNFNYKVLNGEIKKTTKTLKNNVLHEWVLNDYIGLNQDENYMPPNVDIARGVHISTIDSWNDIATWYSDLVRSRIEINSTVQKTFDTLFPNGYKQLSEDERAQIIYNYITENFTYSYVSFKQSGYVPQKPSKTINTALGDCKDFSTLFVTLGQMAELNANLVLILTSDYGQNALVLPNRDFNHCIVKLNLNGKEQFLELTDKYLPYASLPVSLYGATGLNIPHSSNDASNSELFKLKNLNRELAIYKNDVDVFVNEKSTNLNIKTEFRGHINSYYASLLEEPNFEVKKKSFYESLKERLEEDDFTLNELKDIESIEKDKVIKFTTDVTINKKPDEIGSIRIFKLPRAATPYTNSIISTNERKYPIEYIQYETVDEYKTSYNIKVADGKKFIEIPESKSFSFKNQSYSITYKLISDSNLEVNINSKPGFEVIQPEDYDAFKVYVKSILEAEDALIGYK